MIEDLSVTLRSVPLTRPWGPDVPCNHALLVTVTLDDGRRGTGLSWTPQIGAHAIKALLEHDVRDAVIGLPPHPEVVWDRLSARLGEAGRTGIVPIALAGVDLALWDLRCGERPLIEVLGARRESVPVYGSGINRHYPLEELRAQAERWVAAGYTAVKIKVGRPSLAEDVERVAAVREVIGPDRLLMIDANQRWDLHRARTALRALQEYDPFWIEEPLPADDLAAHVELRRGIGTPVAVGENVATAHGFRDLLTAGACDVVQPNVVRVGGITPFLRIAELARVFDVPVYPHLLTELSGQLALALHHPAMVERVEDATLTELGLLADPSPVEFAGAELRATGAPTRWAT
ncbi:mandelate racemase/muconate lactonizing enzyme family protein [Thermomonospora cellulosilytica]|uniref:L-alanine-DL-glutamate epimerase-like enolase superfamily enzyme n=1 Tax=Thermomonospora cellulosilytica TaxID=1411118 RepID=A0A7W3MYK6_9ACTN|nr:mandelate racemase/muconate lactonizing enzyme family protein [Thermomonospora cellulosilytica]MBA9004207.1 L-alanine-DL-glutamate epimerase-like enolase superfamily enzyme [Thermomonospora cellulosilytica]